MFALTSRSEVERLYYLAIETVSLSKKALEPYTSVTRNSMLRNECFKDWLNNIQTYCLFASLNVYWTHI